MHQFGWLSERGGVNFPSERGGNLLQKEGVPRKGRKVPTLEETMPHGNSLGHMMYGLYDIHDMQTFYILSLSISISKCTPTPFCRRGVAGKEGVTFFRGRL